MKDNFVDLIRQIYNKLMFSRNQNNQVYIYISSDYSEIKFCFHKDIMSMNDISKYFTLADLDSKEWYNIEYDSENFIIECYLSPLSIKKVLNLVRHLFIKLDFISEDNDLSNSPITHKLEALAKWIIDEEYGEFTLVLFSSKVWLTELIVMDTNLEDKCYPQSNWVTKNDNESFINTRFMGIDSPKYFSGEASITKLDELLQHVLMFIDS